MTGDALVGPGRDNDPDAFRQLVQQIQDLRRYVDDRSSQILRTAGLRAEPDLLRVLGSLVVEGDLSVPNGSINNDALASPVIPISFQNSASGFGLPSSGPSITVTTATLSAPSGTTRGVVIARMYLQAVNYGPSSAWLYDGIFANNIEASNDQGPLYPEPGNVMSALTVGIANVLSSTITVEGRAHASAGSDADPTNMAKLSGVILWLH